MKVVGLSVAALAPFFAAASVQPTLATSPELAWLFGLVLYLVVVMSVLLPVLAVVVGVSLQTRKGRLKRTAWALGGLGAILLVVGGAALGFVSGEEVPVIAMLFVGAVLAIPLLILRTPPRRRKYVGIAAWSVVGALLAAPVLLAVFAAFATGDTDPAVPAEIGGKRADCRVDSC
ncbi:MAG: hypothetical protein GEU74_05815 [Nitriliruptorales bacterium]|nr:hypothetical protein [Nitriliruptorales bacterium]